MMEASMRRTQSQAWLRFAAGRPLPCAGAPLLRCLRLCFLAHPWHLDLHHVPTCMMLPKKIHSHACGQQGILHAAVLRA